MFYMCTACYRVMRRSKTPKKCKGCGLEHTYVEIDEMMLPVIQMLNRKGYHTEHCCSGHYVDSDISTYIQFSRDIMTPIDGLPNMFEWEPPRYFGMVLRLKECYRNDSEPQRSINIHNGIIQLIRWVESLPYRGILWHI